MLILKLFCLFMTVMSIAGIVAGRNRFDIVWSVVGIVVWPLAFYGIHKRIRATWKLGFAWIVIGACAFVSRALSTAGMPMAVNAHYRTMAVAFVIVGTIIMIVYWGYWWYSQKSYFAGSQPADDAGERNQ